MLGVCHQHLYNAAKHLIWQISPAMATRHRGQQTMLHTPWQQDGGRRLEDRVVGLLLVYGETQKGWKQSGRLLKAEREDAIKERMDSKGWRIIKGDKKKQRHNYTRARGLHSTPPKDCMLMAFPCSNDLLTQYTLSDIIQSFMCIICHHTITEYSSLYLCTKKDSCSTLTELRNRKSWPNGWHTTTSTITACTKHQRIYSEGLLQSFNKQEISCSMMLWKHDRSGQSQHWYRQNKIILFVTSNLP